MSTQSVDSSLVEQTKNQIRVIVSEIQQLSKLDVPPDEYHGEFLHRVISAMGAVGGAVWTFEGGTLTLSYQVNFKEIGLQNDEDGTRKHARLLYRMLHGPEAGTLVPPHSGIEGEEESGNPTDWLLVFCPIRTELEVVGLVEIIQRPDTNPITQRGFLRFLAQVCALATDYYKNRQLRNFGERQNLWTLLEDFTRTIHKSLDVPETSYTIVNEGRRLIECDRVSIALRQGGSCKVVAVSGQDTVDKRATPVRLLGKLATAVVKAGEPIWYTGDTSDFAPQVEKAVEAYVDESHTKMITVYPLVKRSKKNEEEEDDPSKRTKPERPFGALLVEQIEDSRVPERMRKRVEIVADHTCSALGNALDHHSIFLLPLWKTLGKTKVLFSSRMLPKTILVTALAVGLGLAMVFLPLPFRMHCPGKLEPMDRQKIFAPVDAEVEEVYVDHDSAVRGPFVGTDGVQYRGSKLVQLHSPELDNMGEKLRGEEKETIQQIESFKRQLADQDKRLSAYEFAELRGRLDTAMIRLETNRAQQAIYSRQVYDLLVTSPIDGTVVTWKVKEKLNTKRPVSRMQFLMEVADLKGAWQLELSMPEKRMGHIADFQRQLQSKDPNAKLRVGFVLASKPTVWYYGTVVSIHDRAEVRSDTGSAGSASSTSLNTVLIKVALDQQDALPDSLLPGMECSARIDCGVQPAGYVLFHEAIAFVQKNIIFRLF